MTELTEWGGEFSDRRNMRVDEGEGIDLGGGVRSRAFGSREYRNGNIKSRRGGFLYT